LQFSVISFHFLVVEGIIAPGNARVGYLSHPKKNFLQAG
jgi:hypothetical protein